MNDITWLDATAQAEIVRRGEASPAELVSAAIARIEKLDPVLNAVIHRQFEAAEAVARDARTLPDGPFRGVPFLLKDVLCHEAGRPHHCGMRLLKEVGWTEDADTWLAERYRAAGFVILGRTNAPELASTVTTEPLAYGATCNPWDPTRTPGGSSGGSAAAVASGMVSAAHGNDMGGSIRIPASNCGLVGLKPSRARTTLGPDFGEFWGPVTHEHVLTRSVRDTAAILDAVAGPGVGDPYTAPPPIRPWTLEVGAEPGRMRIGYRTALADGSAPDPEVSAAVESTARLLEALGHSVEPVALEALEDPVFAEAIPVIFATVVARNVDYWGARLGRTIGPEELEPMNGLLTEMGRAIPAVQYLGYIEGIQAWSRRMAVTWADGVDVVMLPVTPAPPLPLGEMAPNAKAPFELLIALTRMVSFTLPFNVTGQPAVSVPMHWTDDGLPIGVELVGAYGREDTLLRLASQLEEARPWLHRRPQVTAS